MMQVVQAIVNDRTHLQLTHPLSLCEGETVRGVIDVPRSVDEDKKDWAALAARSLERSYGESEPDYEAVELRETNREYET